MVKKKFLVRLKGGEPFVVFGASASVDSHGYLMIYDEDSQGTFITYCCDSGMWAYCRFIGYSNNG